MNMAIENKASGPSRNASKRTADIAIIGAGIIGLSCAWELARRSDLQIVVFEKNLPGSGTTGGSAGVICLHNLGRLYVQLTLLGYARIRQLRAQFGFHFQPWGDLGVIYDPGEFPPGPDIYHETFDDGPEGIFHREVLGRDEVLRRYPWLRPERVRGGVFHPNQGFIDPHELLSLYEKLATETGRVTICRNTPVLQLRKAGARVSTVVTRKGAWEVGQVLNAAGPWGAKVAELAGTKISLVPQRIQVCVATGFDDDVERAPVTGLCEAVDGEGIWFRGELGGNLLLGQHHHTAQSRFTVDPDYLNRVNDPDYPGKVEEVFRRYWHLPRSVFLNGWCCVYGSTEDGFPIVSRDIEVENFFHAVGMNGHGMTCHAGVALCVAEMMLRGGTAVDLEPHLQRSERLDFSGLNAGRFARDELLHFQL